MTIEQLASADDVESVLGRDLTSDEVPRVEAILNKASEQFRLHARQQFTEGESRVRRKVNGGEVYLPQSPVVKVSSVIDSDGKDVDYERDGQRLTVPLVSHQFVTVEYEHGGDVPKLVRLTVAEMAKRTLTVSDAAAAGSSQHTETTGPWTVSNTFASWAQGGQTLLSPDDVRVARSYRVSAPNVWVGQP